MAALVVVFLTIFSAMKRAAIQERALGYISEAKFVLDGKSHTSEHTLFSINTYFKKMPSAQ